MKEDVKELTDEERVVVDRVRPIAEQSLKEIAEENHRAKFVWLDSDGMPMLFAFPDMNPNISRDWIGHWVRMLTGGLDATELMFESDAMGTHSHVRKNGENWKPGEMQKAMEESTEDADLVYEMLVYQGVTTDSMWSVSIPYDRVGKERVPRWDEVVVFLSDDSETSLEGAIPNLMRNAIKQEKIWDMMKRQFGVSGEDVGLSTEDTRLHTMLAAVKMVSKETEWPIAIGVTSEDQKEIVDRSMRNADWIHSEWMGQ